MSDTKSEGTQADNYLLASFKHCAVNSQILRGRKNGCIKIVVLCTTLISGILYRGHSKDRSCMLAQTKKQKELKKGLLKK